MTPTTTLSLTLSQISVILIFIIGQTIAVARFIYLLMKKDTANETDNKLNRLFTETAVKELMIKIDTDTESVRSESLHQYNQLEIAFQNNCKSCVKKHDDINDRFKETDKLNKEVFSKFTETLERLNDTMTRVDKSVGEHIAFHKGIEESYKNRQNG